MKNKKTERRNFKKAKNKNYKTKAFLLRILKTWARVAGL